jgi:hypothetical protein
VDRDPSFGGGVAVARFCVGRVDVGVKEVEKEVVVDPDMEGFVLLAGVETKSVCGQRIEPKAFTILGWYRW